MSTFLERARHWTKTNIYKRMKTIVYTKHVNNYQTMKPVLLDMKRDATDIFNSAVKAVLPQQLIAKSLRMENEKRLVIGEKTYDVNKNVYVVGFGKAVSGMARAVEDILGDHLVKGVISVPLGIVDLMRKCERCEMLPHPDGKIRLMEGAKDNLPDDFAWQAATNIVSLVSDLDSSDLLLVLISGGGSALLSFPLPPVMLSEKLLVIKELSSKGATIQELNSVRKRLSLVKGGGIAKLAYPAKVAALILSDIVGNPIDLIASGPTVLNEDPPDLPLKILQKYNLLQNIPYNILSQLQEMKSSDWEFGFDHVQNFLVGSNDLALSEAADRASKLGYVPIVLTSDLTGVARDVGRAYANLGVLASKGRSVGDEVIEISNILGVSNRRIDEVVGNCEGAEGGVCVIGGGETVVLVKGTGRGGRNQEMALAAAITLAAEDCSDVMFLSAGTDGIDGPTPAAGALGYGDLISTANRSGIDASFCLKNNDSYGFYTSVNEGDDLIVVGHSGTNVMDLQLLLIR